MPDANTEEMVIFTDPLNVIRDVVPPLSKKILSNIRKGKTSKTQLLDGSSLDQHEKLEPYALTHVSMKFDNEDDIIRCVRILQWSDERMRAREQPTILWAWKQSFRNKDEVYFSVAWYTKAFFDSRKDSFYDPMHTSYYKIFNKTPTGLKIRHEILAE